MFEGLPSYCYSTMPGTKEVIKIKRGEKGYYPLKDYQLEQTTAEQLNDVIGVTKAQAKAMLVGSMFGWYVPGANPLNYDQEGNPISLRSRGRS